MMKNRTLAIFGIATYFLSVYSSQTNPQGESTIPDYVIFISGTATILFTILATVRLWKFSRFILLLLAITSIIYFGLELTQLSLSSGYGSNLILTLNIIKIVRILAFFYVIFFLWRLGNDTNK